jgi:Domain of unkown function (DUF1775)
LVLDLFVGRRLSKSAANNQICSQRTMGEVSIGRNLLRGEDDSSFMGKQTTDFRVLLRRGFLGAVIAVVALSAQAPQTANAHAKAKTSSFPGGSRQTLTFVIEHGCGTSPTNSVALKLPTGVTKPAPLNPKGWTSTVVNGVVTWKGGPLAADKKGSFDLILTFPKTKGIVSFPFVQTCNKGILRWIEGPKSKYPAPQVTLT